MTPAGLSKDSGWSLAAAAAPSAGLAALEMLQHRPTDSTVITLKTSFASGSGDATADNSSDYLAVQVEEGFFFGIVLLIVNCTVNFVALCAAPQNGLIFFCLPMLA